MRKRMYEDLVIAGFGGQGIIFSGKLLSYAGLREGKEVSYFPSYGAEMRGGTANCTVIISDNMIASPIVTSQRNAIIMSQPALTKFLPRIKEKGRVLINSSLVRRPVECPKVKIVEVPANKIAEELGEGRVANMVILGAWVAVSTILPLDSLIHSLKELLSGKKARLHQLNEKALREGEKFASSTD